MIWYANNNNDIIISTRRLKKVLMLLRTKFAFMDLHSILSGCDDFNCIMPHP